MAAKKKAKSTKATHDVQMFGLRIIKEIDKDKKQVHLEIKSKTESMPIAEALLLVEGWVKAEKEKLVGSVFKAKNESQ